jgi:hypothetical protein
MLLLWSRRDAGPRLDICQERWNDTAVLLVEMQKEFAPFEAGPQEV